MTQTDIEELKKQICEHHYGHQFQWHELQSHIKISLLEEIIEKLLTEQKLHISSPLMQTDVIYNITEVKFSFIDRLKLLIGGKSVTRMEIETGNEVVHMKKVTAKTHVQYPEWIDRIQSRLRSKTGEGWSEPQNGSDGYLGHAHGYQPTNTVDTSNPPSQV